MTECHPGWFRSSAYGDFAGARPAVPAALVPAPLRAGHRLGPQGLPSACIAQIWRPWRRPRGESRLAGAASAVPVPCGRPMNRRGGAGPPVRCPAGSKLCRLWCLCVVMLLIINALLSIFVFVTLAMRALQRAGARWRGAGKLSLVVHGDICGPTNESGGALRSCAGNRPLRETAGHLRCPHGSRRACQLARWSGSARGARPAGSNGGVERA